MKRTLVAAVAALVLFGACSSTPEPVEPPDELYDEAKTLRTRIERLELAEYAQSQFDAGEAAFSEGETQYNAEQYAEAETQFNTAIVNYEEVIRVGLGARRSARKDKADEAKTRADGIKASVAVAEQYEEALAVYQEAEAAASAGDDEEAAELFENAETLFEEAYQAAVLKRQRAEGALGNLQNSLNNLEKRRQDLEDEARADAPPASSEGGE